MTGWNVVDENDGHRYAWFESKVDAHMYAERAGVHVNVVPADDQAGAGAWAAYDDVDESLVEVASGSAAFTAKVAEHGRGTHVRRVRVVPVDDLHSGAENASNPADTCNAPADDAEYLNVPRDLLMQALYGHGAESAAYAQQLKVEAHAELRRMFPQSVEEQAPPLKNSGLQQVLDALEDLRNELHPEVEDAPAMTCERVDVVRSKHRGDQYAIYVDGPTYKADAENWDFGYAVFPRPASKPDPETVLGELIKEGFGDTFPETTAHIAAALREKGLLK